MKIAPNAVRRVLWGLIFTAITIVVAEVSVLATDDQPKPLARRPFLGTVFRGNDDLSIVRFVPGGSTADSALNKGDRLMKLGDRAVSSVPQVLAAMKPLRAGEELAVTVERNGSEQRLVVSLKQWPREQPDDFEVLYDQVQVGNKALRCLVTKPKEAASGRVPAVFYIQGIDGASIESPFGEPNHTRDFVYALTLAGFAVMRCEKSGVGDSTGPDCKHLGLGEEVSDFTAALKKLKAYDFVDSGTVFLFGHSAGGWVAPLVANNEPAAGILVYGTVVRAFGEYLVENHRRNRRNRDQPDPGQLELQVRRMSKLWYLLLQERLSPAEALQSDPDLDDVVRHIFRGEADCPYDVRSLAYFRDVNDQNMAAAWSRLRIPVLALIGQYEVRTSDFEHQYIAEIVNSRDPGKGTWRVLPGLDHGFATHESMKDAVDNEFKGPFGKEIVSASVDWMRNIIHKGDPPVKVPR